MKTESKVILLAAPVTANGFTLVSGRSTSGVSLIISVLATPTGTTPGIQFTLTPVDFSPSMLPVDAPMSSPVLNSIGATVVYLPISRTGNIKVSWTVSGGSPNFSSVSATLVNDDSTLVSSTGVTLVDGSGFTQPISAVSLPLPTGAATAALQTQPGVDIGDVTVNNAGGAAAVNIQDGGNSITVDGTFWQATQPVSGLVGLTDTINGTVAVKPASTAPLATDAALVVVMSPNQGSIAVTTSPSNSTGGFAEGDITTASIAIFAIRRAPYTEQTSNAQRSIVSTSANDTAAGTGARTVRIKYLTSTGTGPFSEIITLNGTVAVNTVATNICFIEHIDILTVSSTGSNVGTINLKAAIAGGGATIWSIAPTALQSFGCHHYIPIGKTAYITAQWAGHTGTVVGSGATFVIKSIPIGVANAAEPQISDTFRLYGQSSSVQRNYGSPISVVGPARLTTYVTPETSSSINYRASFDFYEL